MFMWQCSLQSGVILTCYRNVIRFNPNCFYDGKGHLAAFLTWGWHVKSPAHLHNEVHVWKRLFVSLSFSLFPFLLNFLISYIPSLHLLFNNQQSLFLLLLNLSHSFSHHLSFLPFILHGQSLTLLISFSHLSLHLLLIASPLPPSFLPNLPHLFSSFHYPLLSLSPPPVSDS